MIRAILLSGLIVALSAAAQADPQASQAYWSYVRCNEEAARNLFRRQIAQTSLDVDLGVLSRQVLAREAMTACKAEGDALAAALPGGLPGDFAAHTQRFNQGVIETEMHVHKHGILCAGAEWSGCSMKRLPDWKANRH